MGDFVCQSLTMKVVAALVTIALHQQPTGQEVVNFHATAMFPQMYLHLRAVTILERELWTATLLSGEAAPLDPRQCSSSPTVEPSLRSGRGTTMIGTVSTGPCPMPPARDRSGTRGMTWVRDIALLTKLRRASLAVVMVTVLETLSALAAEQVSKFE